MSSAQCGLGRAVGKSDVRALLDKRRAAAPEFGILGARKQRPRGSEHRRALGIGRVIELVQAHDQRGERREPRKHRVRDERLQELVCDLLTDAPDIDPTDVEVSVKSGIVTLNGSVVSRRMKRILEDTVEAIPGVMNVHSHLEVRSMRG